MSSSKIDISNQALLLLGAAPIVSFDDNTVESNTLRVLYGPAKKQILRSYDWNCANNTVRLAELSDPPVDTRWSHAFSVPEDYIRILEVIQVGDGTTRNIGAPVEYEVAGRKVFTNCSNVAARYIADIDEPLLDSHVEMALVARLALDLSYALTASNTRESNLNSLYEIKLNEARTTDAQERSHKKFRIDTLQIARG
jgi:hypothetical protein